MQQEKNTLSNTDPAHHIGLRNSTRRIIMVIDGVESSRQILVEQLSERYDVIEAESGFVGLRILQDRKEDISVIILDAEMPDCSVYQFLKQAQGDHHLETIPIIAVSGHADDAEESRLLELGASDYVKKPTKKSIILSRVQNLIRMREMAGAITLLGRDSLTKLLSYQAFFQYAGELLKSEPETEYSLLITDIDRFTLINAVYGESIGNQLLQSMAAKLKNYVQDGLCGRYSADRFICLAKTEIMTHEWVEELQHMLTEDAIVPDLTVRCGVYGSVDRSLTMVRMCDRAIFAVKSIKPEFKKRIAYYDGPISRRFFREERYVVRFAEAIRKEEFVIWYQPKFDPYQNIVVGAEALVRWKNPDGGFNMPGEFIRIFEGNGMIRQLDDYVFEKVCQQQRRFLDAGVPLIPISINLSRNSMLQNSVAERFGDIAKKYGIDPRYLPIEITESAASNSNAIQGAAKGLAQLGFPIHMDDFGSEHSSLYTLNVLGFETVKLDKGLIDFIGDKMGDIILTFVMALGKTLGIKIVAEGVETKSQLDFLMENGCDQIQGYYFSRPIPGEDFERDMISREVTNKASDSVRENLYMLSMANHIEKLITQRMLPLFPGGFLIYEDTEEAKIVGSNAYIWNLFGCENETDFMDHVGASFRGFVCPEDLDRVEKTIAKQIGENSAGLDYVEYNILRKDGTKVPVVDYGHLERMRSGNLFYVFIYRKENP